jgi:hypothetical protein
MGSNTSSFNRRLMFSHKQVYGVCGSYEMCLGVASYLSLYRGDGSSRLHGMMSENTTVCLDSGDPIDRAISVLRQNISLFIRRHTWLPVM